VSPCRYVSHFSNLLKLVTQDPDTAVSARAGREKSVESKLDAEPERNHFATLRELVRDRLWKLMGPNVRGGQGSEIVPVQAAVIERPLCAIGL
jgi:hypothetical protein